MDIKTKLDNGLTVSTVSLPFMHAGGTYETMVFPEDSWSELDCQRYYNADEAERGHAEMVERWAKEERDGTR